MGACSILSSVAFFRWSGTPYTWVSGRKAIRSTPRRHPILSRRKRLGWLRLAFSPPVTYRPAQCIPCKPVASRVVPYRITLPIVSRHASYISALSGMVMRSSRPSLGERVPFKISATGGKRPKIRRGCHALVSNAGMYTVQSAREHARGGTQIAPPKGTTSTAFPTRLLGVLRRSSTMRVNRSSL